MKKGKKWTKFKPQLSRKALRRMVELDLKVFYLVDFIKKEVNKLAGVQVK